MRERPILFSAPMVRAILAGQKTQTRRIVKPEPGPYWNPVVGVYNPTVIKNGGYEAPGPEIYGAFDESEGRRCPYGQPGDRLWVRETWRAPLAYELTPPRDILRGTPIVYQADGSGSLPHFNAGKLRPSMFMPRWASRILLEITGVRVQRLRSISDEDADAECFGGDYPTNVLPDLFPGPVDRWSHLSMQQCFQRLWESINGDGSWTADPWVWVVEFRRVAAMNGARAAEEQP